MDQKQKPFPLYLVDDEPPEITGCPGTIRRVASAGSNSVEVTWIEPTVSDNTGSVYWESKPAEPGSSFSVGTSDLTYVASDGFGNKATCSFQIVISGKLLSSIYLQLRFYLGLKLIHVNRQNKSKLD